MLHIANELAGFSLAAADLLRRYYPRLYLFNIVL